MGFVVFNDKTGSLTWDKTNIDRLPKTDQAALWVHEGVYKYLRESKGDTDSRRARLIVAHLFSTETAEQASAAILEALGGVHPTTDVSSPFQLSGSSTQVFIGRRTDGPGGPEVRLNSDESLDWKNTFAASSHFVEEAEDWHFGQSLHINVVNELIQVNPEMGTESTSAIRAFWRFTSKRSILSPSYSVHPIWLPSSSTRATARRVLPGRPRASSSMRAIRRRPSLQTKALPALSS